MSGLQIAFRFLVENLRAVKNVRSVRVLDQGAMVINVVQQTFEEEIVVYLLAGELSVGFVKKTLNANTQRDKHTLFIVSYELISEDGQNALMSDALHLLMQAYGGKVFAYRIDENSVTIFPVFITDSGHITLGQSVNLADIGGDYATFNNKYLLGVRKVAGFEAKHYQHAHNTTTIKRDDPLQAFFDLLGVSSAASMDEIKKAYRKKARQHHPDTDKSPGATERMQAINEAYARIVERMDL